MEEAVSRYVTDGSTVCITGFSHAIGFAAAHEIIRQRLRGLTLVRATPDLVYDQMIGAGCATKLVFSWLGNPGVGMLSCAQRAIAASEVEIEEYTHGSLVARLRAAASGLTFYPIVPQSEGGLAEVNPAFASVKCPFSGRDVAVVPSLPLDVAFVHVQRASAEGDAQLWGILGEQIDAAFAAKHVIVTAEYIVDPSVIRSDPNRTVIPSFVTDAVVASPWGAHPSYVQGEYDRDNSFYREWAEISRYPGSFHRYLDEWVYGVANREEYAGRLDARLSALRAVPAFSEPVSYGIGRSPI